MKIWHRRNYCQGCKQESVKREDMTYFLKLPTTELFTWHGMTSLQRCTKCGERAGTNVNTRCSPIGCLNVDEGSPV